MAQKKDNEARTNAIKKMNKKTRHIYKYTPNATANKSGKSVAVDNFGACTIVAPEPIALVVYMYWKDMSDELKQFSRVTSAIDESPSSANSMSTH
jgi:23S rRNA maturation mini-RNase III